MQQVTGSGKPGEPRIAVKWAAFPDIVWSEDATWVRVRVQGYDTAAAGGRHSLSSTLRCDQQSGSGCPGQLDCADLRRH